MNGLRDRCHCGHDLDTHYADRSVVPPVRRACLGMYCECLVYVNEWTPKPIPHVERPLEHRYDCQCFRCVAFRKQEGIDFGR